MLDNNRDVLLEAFDKSVGVLLPPVYSREMSANMNCSNVISKLPGKSV